MGFHRLEEKELFFILFFSRKSATPNWPFVGSQKIQLLLVIFPREKSASKLQKMNKKVIPFPCLSYITSATSFPRKMFHFFAACFPSADWCGIFSLREELQKPTDFPQCCRKSFPIGLCWGWGVGKKRIIYSLIKGSLQNGLPLTLDKHAPFRRKVVEKVLLFCS